MTYSDGKTSASKNKDAAEKRRKPLWEGHRERLRRRMEREGWDALKPHEMVELVLYHAVPRQDLSDISRVLVDRFGSVGGVFSASRERLTAVEGMTPVLAEWILTTGELMRAYCDLHGQKGIRLSCYQELIDFLRPRAGKAGDAKLWVIYSDFDFNLITYTALLGSGEWWVAENMRRIVTEAVNVGARYAYLVRFLDSPFPDMDPEDEARLEAMAVTLRAVDVELVDCVLVGGDAMRSMNAEGRMQRIRAESKCGALHERYARSGAGDNA